MNRNVTVVPVDNLIIVDSEPLVFSFQADEDIHAIQWSGGLRKGHIEVHSQPLPVYLDTEDAYEEHVAPFVTLWENRKAWLQAEQEQEQELEEAHFNPVPTLEEAKAQKLTQIDAETSAAIVAGFDYEVDGEILHFAYDTHDQQNFADTANMVNFSLKGIPGVPESIPWNGWKIEKDETGVEVSRSLVRLDLDANAFLALYMQGAMMHKAGLMELGGQRKAQVDAATTIEELEGI